MCNAPYIVGSWVSGCAALRSMYYVERLHGTACFVLHRIIMLLGVCHFPVPRLMLASRWLLLLVYPHAVGATECLVGCLVQGIDPFDDANLAIWDDRDACDASTIGCEIDARGYPSSTFKGALWASTTGTDGSSSCTCDICDPFPYGGTTGYMSDETSLWTRIQCYIGAAEAAGYNVSPCVAAVLDTGTLACVEDVYEAPSVPLFECEDNVLVQNFESNIEVCDWAGTTREAQEMSPATSGPSSTSADTPTCLVGCLVQEIDPFEDVDQAIWDSRGVCDSTTIGCEVSAITYPTLSFLGALWTLSSGTDGSSGCTCNICDPLTFGGTADYMPDESLWSRIQCFLAASESSGYDVSPCVAAILDTGTLPCVDDVYEAPTVGLLQCESNGISDLDASSSVDQCIWAGDIRLASELFEAPALVPSPLPKSTPSPLQEATSSPLQKSTSSPLPDPTPSPIPDLTKAPSPAPRTSVPDSTTPVPINHPMILYSRALPAPRSPTLLLWQGW